jgi:hypothetical protein
MEGTLSGKDPLRTFATALFVHAKRQRQMSSDISLLVFVRPQMSS